MEVRCYIYLHMTITLKQFLSKLITSLTCFGSFFFQSPNPQQKLDTLLSTMDTVQKKKQNYYRRN